MVYKSSLTPNTVPNAYKPVAPSVPSPAEHAYNALTAYGSTNAAYVTYSTYGNPVEDGVLRNNHDATPAVKTPKLHK
jgi:hypothetical protein